MSQPRVYGRLKIPEANYLWDMQFVKASVTVTGEPQLTKELFDERIKFWAVQFTCPRDKWRELEPELQNKHIEANLYDAIPELYFSVKAAEEREGKRIQEKSRRQMMRGAGVILGMGGLAEFFLHGFSSISLVLLIGGFLLYVLGDFLLVKWADRRREANHARRQ